MNAENGEGETPLHLAAHTGKKDMVVFLVSQGASINARDAQDRTPLKLALTWKRNTVASYLRSRGGVE